jgi:RNA polymerase sigma factor (sigma-70 family)
MYNRGTMTSGNIISLISIRPSFLDSIELFRYCAANRENSEAWSEFLTRYGKKIKCFINKAIRRSGTTSYQNRWSASAGIQQIDLFQDVIVRLVENDCAVMKRFCGNLENELLAYLAAICRSCVLDTLRQSNALKRRATSIEGVEAIDESACAGWINNQSEVETRILTRELMDLIENNTSSPSAPNSNRDRLVFKLHFLDGLSYHQISQCKGINLSKAGIDKLLRRLVVEARNLAGQRNSREMI